MRFRAFSRQQRRVLTWWCSAEGQSREAVICDGAVRSGKTLCMGLAFFLWATACFDGMAFGLCGKTITALRRNLLREVLPTLGALGFQWREQASQNRLTVRLGGKENTFYLFGGRDEGSAALIQGITLAGVLLDEAALMPRSFVEQACARCSVPGSRMWFSCNPEHPEHWFYKEWILKAEERRALYLHFTMEDTGGRPHCGRRPAQAGAAGGRGQGVLPGERCPGGAGLVPPACEHRARTEGYPVLPGRLSGLHAHLRPGGGGDRP